MGSLTVDLNALGDVTEKFKDLIEKNNIILNDFNSQKNCIDFDIAERDNIRYDLNEVSKKLKSISEYFITYDRQINDAIDTYADTEEKLKSFILELDTSDRKESTNNNAKPADVTVGKVKVRDSKVTDGVTTGYLVDIIEGLGGTAEWDGKTRTTTVKLNGKTIVYDLKNMKDGVGHASDGTTFTVKDGHIHVGVREVSEKAGANIKWSPNTTGGVTVNVAYTNSNLSSTTIDQQQGEINNLMTQFVDSAKNELKKGFKENNGDNDTPYGKWYGLNKQPWCAMFVSYVANQAGIAVKVKRKNLDKGKTVANTSNPSVPKEASVYYQKKYYIIANRYQTRESGYKPNEGDIIFFDKHVGIVTLYDSDKKKVYTIEGNSDNAVRLRTYSEDSTYIKGYGVNGGTNSGTLPSEEKATNGSNAKTR
ncbi:hypothetical protein SH1V18_26780 [Vallitalea longa]|uniref:Uncharacterized protein n=1 Tax=Vallitalea longa TaxID=2936439 RepID=A0A9W6DG83_9FIRM|nr:CHAP domain-containing protein [Vallitalea longa]GKX30198.1 hypothetical protein SH1V18_26780 [Vallitalea longa]